MTGRNRLIALLAAAIAAAGCAGDDGGRDRSTLTAQERREVREARITVHSYCGKVALYLAGRRAQPGVEFEQRAESSLERLIAVATEHPDAILSPTDTMRDVIADTAEDLEGSNCAPSFRARLDQALANLPPPR